MKKTQLDLFNAAIDAARGAVSLSDPEADQAAIAAFQKANNHPANYRMFMTNFAQLRTQMAQLIKNPAPSATLPPEPIKAQRVTPAAPAK